MSEVLNRNLKLLHFLPREPHKTTAQLLSKKLEHAGFIISERSVQRDLNELAINFEITCDEGRPFYWYWLKDASVYDLPHMDKNIALSFYLSEQFSQKLMPPSIAHHLAPNFKHAKSVLDDKKQNSLKKWRDRIRVLSRTQPLLSPKISENTIEVVYQALLEGKKFSVTYTPRHSDKIKQYEVSPLGIVLRDQLVYLVATLWRYEKPIQLLLNRMSDAKALEQPIIDNDFNLDDYIAEGHFEYLASEGDISLHLNISKFSLMAFEETPLSKDQTIKPLDDGHYLVIASVKDTHQLRWWLMGFGDGIEVLKPLSLRNEMSNMAKSMVNVYKGKK